MYKLKIQGRHAEALDCFDQALALNPNYAEAFSNKLLTAHYDERLSPRALFLEHQRFSKVFEQPLVGKWPLHSNDPDPNRRLRIGYVSPDFRQHPVGCFIEPVIDKHDKIRFEVFCYSNDARTDAVTGRLKTSAEHWVECKGWSDVRLADRIQSDQIDILVDLSGHTANNRLLTFARKPAPVQVSWLGYVATTGLKAMDYRLGHVDTDGLEAESTYSEAIHRFSGHLWWCYRPHPEIPAVSPSPAKKNGFVTFGSTNNYEKVTSRMIELWAEILRRVPESRLIVAGVPENLVAKDVAERFSPYCIDPSRLTVVGKVPLPSFWALHEQIDIALDTFPYNGGTTTCDALWLGVPVITLTGSAFVSRMGHAHLKAVGLPNWVAHDEAEYVNVAVRKANSIAELTVLRKNLRQRMEQSVLCDEKGFTEELESAYRSMWRDWCSEGSERIQIHP